MASENWQVSAREKIGENRKRFDRALSQIKSLREKGRLHEAAMNAQGLAHFAWLNHCGIFRSVELENELLQIGLKVCPSADDADFKREPIHILHILTVAHDTGGHTRLVWRWIDRDSGHKHSIVLTQQPKVFTAPADLQRAARASGGELKNLGEDTRDLLARASALRKMALNFDMIITHIDPFDVIPLIAFADKEHLPPVLFDNQADHVFSIGLSVTSLLVNLRDGGGDLAVARRGVDPAAMVTLPIPLEPVQRKRSRAEAKAELGLPPDELMLLSVAQNFKYGILSEQDNFLQWQKQILTAYPNAHLVVVGPVDGPFWQNFKDKVGGRLRVVAATPKIKTYFEAADIYVDSYPMGSPTSALDAGLYETPVTGHRLTGAAAGVLRGGSPGVDKIAKLSLNPQAHFEQVQNLIDDPAARAALGRESAEAIKQIHLSESWKQSLAYVYERAAKSTRLEARSSRDELSELDTLLTAIHRGGGVAVSHEHLLLRHLLHFRPAFALKYLFKPVFQLRAFLPTVRKIKALLKRKLGS